MNEEIVRNDFSDEARQVFSEAELGKTKVPLGLVGNRDKSVIESKFTNLEKQLAVLGEEVSVLINRITPIRRLATTTQSADELRKDMPEEHASDMAIKLEQLSRQVQYITNNVKNATSELEV